jgi:hypothetical protein
MTLREYLKHYKTAAMKPVPWIFPYLAGAAVGVVSVNLSMKFKGLVPIHKDLIYVPMAIAEHMNATNAEIVATVLNPKFEDGVIKLFNPAVRSAQDRVVILSPAKAEEIAIELNHAAKMMRGEA